MTDDEARLHRATEAGFRAVRDGLIKVRASLMQQLAELPRDGTADDVRRVILLRLEAINDHLPAAIAAAPDDAEEA